MENKVAKILRSIGKGTMIGGTIFAIILGFYLYNEVYSLEDGVIFAIVVSIIFTEFVTGMLFIGFSEVIYLLQKGVNNSKNQPTTNYARQEAVIQTEKKTNVDQIENNSIIKELNSYKELLATNIISQEEYDKKEKELLSMIRK